MIDDGPARGEQRILGGATRERPDGHADGLRLRPAALPRPGVEPREVTIVEVDLQLNHIMITPLPGRGCQGPFALNWALSFTTNAP